LISKKVDILYFGCWDRAGHFLWAPDKSSIRDLGNRGEITDRLLDSTPLLLPYPEKKGSGCRTYLSAPDKTVLSWWGNPFDDRPGVNNSVIVDGNRTVFYCWEMFTIKFPDLAKRWNITTADNENKFTIILVKPGIMLKGRSL
jgi:hypothetical protein